MPLDGTNWKPAVKTLQTGLAGLKQIADALRCIPTTFRWDFVTTGDSCGTYGCAIGLARRLWPGQVDPRDPNKGLLNALNLHDGELSAIFGLLNLPGHPCPYGGKPASAVTSHEVASVIECYITDHQ